MSDNTCFKAMKARVPVTVVLLLLGCPLLAEEIAWKDLKDSHFVIYHTEGDRKFFKEVLRRSESYYESIPRRLGMRINSPWTWENRAKIYLHSDRITFLNETGQQNWVRAIADYTNRTIISYKGHSETPFVESSLPHELTHLVFREYVGFDSHPPLWLDEGVAQLMELDRVNTARTYVKGTLDTDNFFSARTLTKLDIRRVRDRELVKSFYLESCSLIDFMIEKYGTSRFVSFCRGIRGGKTLNDALRSAYSSSISNVEKLDEKWKEHIRSSQSALPRPKKRTLGVLKSQ